MTRHEALQQLATDPRYLGLTAGEALRQLSQAFQIALVARDLAFFELHRDDPCHEVARACAGGHVWRGDENGESAAATRKPHWNKLEQQVVPQVIRKT